MWILKYIPTYSDEPEEIGYNTQESALRGAQHLLRCKVFKGNMYTIEYKLM